MPSKRLKEEKQHHREAFEVYYMMGEERSIRAVARKLDRNKSTVQTWADSFNWKERAVIRDAQVQEHFTDKQKKHNESLVEMKAMYHKFLKALIAEAVESIKNKKLKIESVGELLRVMEMDLSLLGEDDRKQQNQMEELNNAIRASVQLFADNGEQFTYDGNDRVSDNDNS